MGPKTQQSLFFFFLHDNAQSQTAKPAKEALKALGWDILSHQLYSPDLAFSDYHLFTLMGYTQAEQNFANFEEVKKWLNEWFGSKDKQFF